MPRRLRGPRPSARHQALQARRIDEVNAAGNARMAASTVDRVSIRERLDKLEAAVAEMQGVVDKLKASSLVNPNKP